MIGLLFTVTVEFLSALIVWLLIMRFAPAGKGKRRPQLIGFLVIWAVLILIDISYRSDPVQQPESTIPGTVTAIDAATFAKNKPELLALVEKVTRSGVVDKQTHDHFWSLMPASFAATPGSRQASLPELDVGIRFQKAFWESMLLSAQAHQVVKTQAFEEASRQVDLTNANAAKSEAMLQAAASGMPYTFSNGTGTVVFNETYAKSVLSTIDGTFARLKILFDPVWHADNVATK